MDELKDHVQWVSSGLWLLLLLFLLVLLLVLLCLLPLLLPSILNRHLCLSRRCFLYLLDNWYFLHLNRVEVVRLAG